MEKEKLVLNTIESWEQLVNKMRFLDIKILEYIYISQQGTTYFTDLVKRMDKFNVKRTAVRNHINKLEKAGLVETINSGVLLINSIPEITENVRKLILKCKLRWDI